MDIYVALRDDPQGRSTQSFVVGAFGDETAAQIACQADADDDTEAYGWPKTVLVWEDAEATLPDGAHYAVVLVDLGTRVA